MPETLYFTWCLQYVSPQERLSFSSMSGSVLDPPKQCLLQCFLMILEVSSLNPKNARNSPDDGPSWVKSPQSWSQKVQIIHTQSHTHTKNDCLCQTSNIKKFIVVGHIPFKGIQGARIPGFTIGKEK